MSFQAEKFIKENGDKIPAEKKSATEAALNSLKEAVKSQNLADIDKYTEELNKAMSELYQGMGSQQGAPQDGESYGQSAPGAGDNTPDEQ